MPQLALQQTLPTGQSVSPQGSRALEAGSAPAAPAVALPAAMFGLLATAAATAGAPPSDAGGLGVPVSLGKGGASLVTGAELGVSAT